VIDTGPQTPYEAYCYNCNVSAPPDARYCVHCGGRLSRQRGVPAPTSSSPYSGPAAAGDEDTPGRMGSTSPMTVVWILLFLIGTLYRLCA